MKKIKLALFIVLIFSASSIYANNRINNLLKKADSAYNAQDFYIACQIWESIVENGYINDDIYYNLGNASYRMGDLSKAIWFYKKSLLLSRYNVNAQENLNLLVNKGYAQLLPQPMGVTAFFNKFFTAIPYNTLFWISWVVFILIGILILIFIFRKKYSSRGGIFLILVVLSICFIYFISSFIYQNINIYNSKSAIISVPSTNLRSSPDSLSIAVAIVNEGTEVKCLESLGNWEKVLTPSQKTGWLQREYLFMLRNRLPDNK